MTFESPLWLLALLVVPALIVAYIVRERRRPLYQARFASLALLPNVVDHRPGIRRHLPVAVLFVALAALIVGVTGYGLERARFGPSDQSALSRVETELRQRFDASAATLGAIATRLAAEPDTARAAPRGCRC